MSRVAYTRENVDKCWCGSCPVQINSTLCHADAHASHDARHQFWLLLRR